MKTYLSAAAVALLVCVSCASTKPAAAPPKVEDTPVDVTIDHASGLITPSGLIRKRPGDVIHIQIQHTNLDCYSFNANVAATTSGQEDVTTHALDQHTDFGVRYDGDPITITIAAFPRAGATGCPVLPDRKPGGTPGPWEIKVANDGWDLAFAGAFTADNLTDPKFSIEQSSPATSAGAPAQYTIFKDKGDSVRLGSAAMVHLYHTEPDPNGGGGVFVVPFSFGLGVGDASHVRYYMGPGIRFDKKLFLNLGVVLGPQATLSHRPSGTTTDANFLTSHSGTRTAAKFFFSVSYSFIGVGPDAFKGPFSSVMPQPSNPPPSDGGGEENPDVQATVSKAATGDAFTYKLEVTNDGADAEDLSLESAFPATAKGTWKIKATGGADCGAEQATAQAKLTATIAALPKKGKCEYDVTLDQPATFTAPTDVRTTVKDADGTTIFPAQ
jgi:hypothetical protein